MPALPIATVWPLGQKFKSTLKFRPVLKGDIAVNGAEAIDFERKNAGRYELGIVDLHTCNVRAGRCRALEKKRSLFPYHWIFQRQTALHSGQNGRISRQPDG